MIIHRSQKKLCSRFGRSSKLTIYILLQALICIVSIRCQVTNGKDLENGGLKSISPQAVGQQSDTPLDANVPSQFASTSDQSNDVDEGSSDGRNSNDQADNSVQSPNAIEGSQNTAAATISTSSSSTSPTARPSSKPRPNQTPQRKSRLSDVVVGGIIFASVVAGIVFITLAVMYFRKLERAIAEDKRRQREKQARQYKMPYRGSGPVPSYLTRSQPSSFEV